MHLSDKYNFLTDYFTKLLSNKTNRFPQSILFYGSDFDAQYSLAKEIARLLNCKEGQKDDCECLNCKWIRGNSHPAVMTISKIDNKPADDDSKTVISIKQSALIKETLVSSSEFHRVFIFCDKDENGNISGLNKDNFQAETANSLLKIIEEPQPGVTFIFLTRYIEDLLSTIISRSQCFYVPKLSNECREPYREVLNIIDNYWSTDRKQVFEISQKLMDLSKDIPVLDILDDIHTYILRTLKNNPKNHKLIKHIEILEEGKKQAQLGIKPINIFDDICLKIIK